MTIRIEANTSRDLDIAIRIAKRLSDNVEFSRRNRVVMIDDASGEDFSELADFFTAHKVECRAVVDSHRPGEQLPPGW